MSDKDREAFEADCRNCEVYTGRHHEYPEQYRLYETQLRWMGWQAARDHYAPKLTEREAVELAAEAIRLTPKKRVTAFCETKAAPHGDGSDMKITHEITTFVEDREAQAKEALHAAGVRFREGP
jgi:hypothetical protein